MANNRTQRRSRPDPDAKVASEWKAFYNGAGRGAIAALFAEFGIYTPPGDNDPYAALRRDGQRDVLLRIAQHIGRKPDAFPDDAVEDEDVLYRMMSNFNG